jgi:hypothetical protein
VNSAVTGNRRSLGGRFNFRERIRDRDTAVYSILLVVAILFPIVDI